MTYEGARNNTAVEMENVLHVEQDNDSFHEYMKALYEYLNENSEYNVSTANALWPDVGFELLPDFEQIIQDYYGGHSEPVEYGDPAEAVRIINEWVENQTNNLIQDLIHETDIHPVLTKLILTNAIYFKGVWQVQFDEVNTTERDFIVSTDETIPVKTMRLNDTSDKFNYTETDDLQILELPYTGDDISMMIFLPRAGVELSDVTNSLNREDYTSWIDEMYKTKADIYLPKFNFETSYGLNKYLIELGMVDAFSAYNADFSGIDGRPDLYISSVLHKAFVEVNEEGTEAAAATAVIMNLKAMDPSEPPERITFDCDHPFIFTIHHKETGTILFMGTVGNPSLDSD
jgi:serpin B